MFAKLSKIAVVVIVTNHLCQLLARPTPTVLNCSLNLLKISPGTPHSAVYKLYCNELPTQYLEITQYGVTGSS